MRKKNFKCRCEKRVLGKCDEVCRTYDAIQYAYADLLTDWGWSLMRKYDLLRPGDSIIRVLEIQGDRVLVIDCIKRPMPVWVTVTALESYSECTNDDLSEVTGIVLVGVEDLDADQRKTMYERYTMIAPILPLVADNRMRSQLICSIADVHGASKQTIRSYLCLYLAYMDVASLAPKCREDNRALTQDEKNIRWALNKFFYTTKKQSLMTAYTMMLKERYCDALGVLAEEYPSFYQFRYFYRKTRNLQNFYIYRDGLKTTRETIDLSLVTGYRNLLLLSERGCLTLPCVTSTLSTTLEVWWVDLY